MLLNVVDPRGFSCEKTLYWVRVFRRRLRGLRRGYLVFVCVSCMCALAS